MCLTYSQAQSTSMDTVAIKMNSYRDINFYPQRGCVSPRLETHQNAEQIGTRYIDSTSIHQGYRDSIKVNFQVINKYKQSYYLIVYDSLGIKRLEGTFYDKFPDGEIFEYYENGILKATGIKKRIKSKKRFIVCKGSYCCPKIKSKIYDNWYSVYVEWSTYSKEGELLFKSEYNHSTKESWVTNYAKNGDIAELLYYKKGKLKKLPPIE